MPKLILKRKAEVIKEYHLKGANSPFTIGSEPGNDVVVPDKLVSMTHFQIEQQGDKFFVRDLKSAFGTYVNGTKIGSVKEIHDGDVIQVGEHTLMFKNGEARDNGAGVGQSISEFFNDVKDAVINTADSETGKARPAEEKTAFAAGTAARTQERSHAKDNAGAKSRPAGSHRHAEAEIEIEDLEKEFSEALGKNNATEASPSSTAAGGIYQKSPYYLLAIHGPYTGKKYQLNFGETKIGRDGRLNDIVIRQNKKGQVDPSISRRHATISYQNGKFSLTDKRSQSRTYLNQQKLAETDEVRLAPGDEIEIVSDQQSTIFRFVAEGNWDFSPPQRAGQWWLRYRMQAVNAATVGVIVLGLVFSILALRNRGIVTNVPEPFKVEFKTFTKIDLGQAPKSKSSKRDREIVPTPVLAEINGDDYVDLLATPSSGALLAIDGKNRRRLWETNNIVLNRAFPPAAADVNGNGMADIVALTADGHLVAIDGLYGAEIWMSPFFEKDLIGPPIVADFNGDGHADVAAISVEGKLNVGYSQVFNLQWVEVAVGVECKAPLSAGDLNGDGDDEILIGTAHGIVLIYDGGERRVTLNFDLNEELSKLKGNLNEVNPIIHPIAIADLNGDQTPDLIISSALGNLLCISLSEKAAAQTPSIRSLWWANLASGRKNAAPFAFPFALANLDNDEITDVVALADDGSIKGFRGRGTVGQQQPDLWETLPDTTGGVTMPTVCDFNKDGTTDIAVVNEKRALKILNGKNGEALWRDDKSIAYVTSMPLLADLLDDTMLDMVLLSGDGIVYGFKTNRRVPGGGIWWGQKHGTSTNASAPAMGEPTAGRYTAQLILCGVVMLGVMAGNIIFHQRRRRYAK
jgi:pSer/pThr/pTyr-binding forkhead associated (FHA) protein